MPGIALAVGGWLFKRLKGPVVDFVSKRALKAHWTGLLTTVVGSTEVNTIWSVLWRGIFEGAQPGIHEIGVAIGATVMLHIGAYFAQWQGWANKQALPNKKD